MKALSLIGALIFGSVVLYGQSKKLFDITETFQDSASMRTRSSFKAKDSSFFEDQKYIVRRTCSGEWGGTIWFKNKATGITRSCASTCPVCINKLNGKYYVTNALAHLSGFSQVLEIEKPDSMRVFKLPKPRSVKGGVTVRYSGDGESKSIKGAKILADSIGILTLASFPYQGELFYIVTDFEETFVDKIEENSFVTVDTVSKVSIWTYNPIMTRTIDDHFIVFFENDITKGYIDIFENRLSLYRYSVH